MLFHFQTKDFGPAWLTRYFPSNGRGWVVVFFVMSGFLVSMIAERKSASEFVIDRAVRIYPVAAPALLFSFLLSLAIPSIGSVEYVQSLKAPALTYAANAVFLSQSWSLDLLPYLDGPYWSLSYEVMYYAIFAAAFYTTGVRRIAIVACALLLAGPKIVAMFPCWLAGVAAYRLRTRRTSTMTGWFVWIAAPVILVIFFKTGGREFANSFSYFNGTTSEGYVRSWIVGAAVAINIWAACQIYFPFPNWLKLVARKAAGFSFSLYLLHLPVICLLAETTGYRSTLSFVLVSIPVVLLASAAFASVTEGRRKSISAAMNAGVRLD
jgi:peptidoglycan/LPS O-acetylase OafA/YrhL